VQPPVQPELEQRRGWSPWRAAVHQQRRWTHAREDGVGAGPGAPSAREPLRLPEGWPADLSSDGEWGRRAHHSGATVAGDRLGIIDPVCPSGGVAEGRMAGGRCAACRDRAPSPASMGNGRSWATNGNPTCSKARKRIGNHSLYRMARFRWPRWRLRAGRSPAGMVCSDRGCEASALAWQHGGGVGASESSDHGPEPDSGAFCRRQEGRFAV